MIAYEVSAFTRDNKGGNLAGVIILDELLSDQKMQEIAKNLGYSESAFIEVFEKNIFNIRFFTTEMEVDLCGHATLASAYVIMNYYEKDLLKISFETLSGELVVEVKNDLYELDFPIYNIKQIEVNDLMEEVLGIRPKEAWIARDLVCILENEEQVKKINIDLDKAKKLEGLLVHVSAQSSEYDCISRSFAPKFGVDEDPVCGSDHSHIVPYWSTKLNKNKIIARQASSRGGTLYCEIKNERIKMAGKAVLYAISDIFVTI